MSYAAEITMLVEATRQGNKTLSDLIAPLVDNIGRLVISADRKDRGARDGIVEIIRNDIDEAVARHDQLRVD